jgi:membrane protein implicated in regulation of membrane protease activity
VERTLALQWVFLVLGLVAAIAELNSGTFYLAGVAVAAFLTSVSGLWLRADWLPIAFLVFCIGLLPVVLLLRRRLSRGRSLPDPDVGQIVTVVGISEGSGRLTVSYRGSRWEGVLERGTMPEPGQSATITRKTDKLLHLAGKS